MPLSLHSGKNIYMGNNALQEQNSENNNLSFSFFSVSHRLLSVRTHRDNSPQFITRSALRSRTKKSTPILLSGTDGSLSILHAQHQKLQHSWGSQGSKNATASFQDVLLSSFRSPVCFSTVCVLGLPVLFSCPHCTAPTLRCFPHRVHPPCSTSTFRSAFAFSASAIFLLTHPLCFPHMFPVMAPEILAKGCTALCWQRDGVSQKGRHWDSLCCSSSVGSHRDAESSGQHIHSSAAHWSPVSQND